MSYECTIDLTTALDWQRSNASQLNAIITAKQKWYEQNHCDFWNAWVADVFNLATANEFGLSVWSVILDEPVFGFTPRSEEEYPAFGFNDEDDNFFNGSFGTNSGASFQFSNEQVRILLQLKAFILHMNGSTRDTNQALKRIFGDNQIICIDGLDMTLTYLVLNDSISSFVREIRLRGLLPKPSGVRIRSVVNTNNIELGS